MQPKDEFIHRTVNENESSKQYELAVDLQKSVCSVGASYSPFEVAGCHVAMMQQSRLIHLRPNSQDWHLGQQYQRLDNTAVSTQWHHK